jgi:protein tyrosine/serine phosphatase
MEQKGIAISDDAQSVNFREIRVGNIAPAMLYRSSHPIQDNRQEPILSLLAAKYRIAAVINLSDNASELKRKVFLAPWYKRLFAKDRAIALGMGFSVIGASYNKRLKKALQFIIKTEGPWLIHCHAGVDRTGFVAMVLEALMGATIDEIADDYLMSFNSVFESTVEDPANKLDSQLVMRLLSAMGGAVAMNDRNLQGIAEQYLRDTIGLSAEEINLLKTKLSGT